MKIRKDKPMKTFHDYYFKLTSAREREKSRREARAKRMQERKASLVPIRDPELALSLAKLQLLAVSARLQELKNS